MKKVLSLAILAFAILAGCKKDDVASTEIVPPPTQIKDIIPAGAVDAPYLAVKVVAPYSLGKWIKLRLDGSAWSPLSDLNGEDFDEQAQKMVMLENNSIFTVDLATNTKTQICANSRLMVQSICLSNDGNTVLFTALRLDRSGTDLYVAPALPSASPVRINQLPAENDVLSACFSPDASHIAYCANGIVYVTDVNGEQKIRVSCDAADCYMDDCSGDRWPAFVDGGRKLMFMSNRHCQDPLDESWSKNWVVCDVMQGAETTAADLSPNTPGLLPAYNDRLLMTSADDGENFYWIGHNEYASPFRLYRVPMNGSSPVLLAKDITAPEKYNIVAAVKYIR